MKQSESSHELLLSDTLVPDIFVTQYAQELSKEAICVYLWLLMNCGYNEFSREEIYSYSILSKDDADKATAGLIENGLLLSSSEDKKKIAVLAIFFLLIDLFDRSFSFRQMSCQAPL